MTSWVCDWSLCVDKAEADSPWCAQHRLLAVQHDTSHELEGHSVAVEDCPRCEHPDGWVPPPEHRVARWSDQCPQRGPSLTHARTYRDPLGVCVHCQARMA